MHDENMKGHQIHTRLHRFAERFRESLRKRNVNINIIRECKQVHQNRDSSVVAISGMNSFEI